MFHWIRNIRRSRIEYMLKDSEAENLLVIDRYRSLVGFYDQNVISLDDVAAESKDFAFSVELTAQKPENLAYMIYTSVPPENQKVLCLNSGTC